MIRKHKITLLITSAVILLPMLFGLILWPELPQEMAVHWNAGGVSDGWGGKAFVVFSLPLFLLAMHWLCVFFTAIDPRNKNQDRKVVGLVLWIVPIVSLFMGVVIYSHALGMKISISTVVFLLLGLLFVVIGNYLPKSTRNYSIGIKVAWALDDDANWQATHRFAGRLYVIIGALLILCAFFPQAWMPWISMVMLVMMLVMAVVPVIYSYLYYKKHKEQ